MVDASAVGVTLHAELARVAEHEGVSLNTLITGALAVLAAIVAIVLLVVALGHGW